ncbi:MAG: hypothetical protein ABR886_01845 [Dehalococcoidales bacterium]|jgi:hypothetical protein
MPDNKHYVYSARTTEKGLALLNKTKGDKVSWDAFINEAVAAHYNLDLATITLPPSQWILDRDAKRKAKEAEKAAKAKAKKATNKKAKETKKNGKATDGNEQHK